MMWTGCILFFIVAGQASLIIKDRIQLNQHAEKVAEEKHKRLVQLVQQIKPQQKIPSYLVPEPWSRRNHTMNGPAIFAAAFASGFKQKDAIRFCGTLLSTGFNGDIVLAMLPNPDRTFRDELKKIPNVIVYTVPLICRQYRGVWCHFPEEPGYSQISIKTIRFRLYQWWSSFYKPTAMLMLSDYRDVFFQTNPFTYHPEDWYPPRYQLVVFQEAFFNVIGRCPFHIRWFTDCYGIETLQKFQTLPVICSGVTIGTRDAIMVYAYFINQQLQPDYRLGHNTTVANHNRCVKGEVDQAFRDFFIYEKVMDPYMDVKIFSQGEGPVNTLGAFYFHHDVVVHPTSSNATTTPRRQNVSAKVELSLQQWGILKPSSSNVITASMLTMESANTSRKAQRSNKLSVYNWNNEKSPCVHQLDRFSFTELPGGYEQYLDVFDY